MENKNNLDTNIFQSNIFIYLFFLSLLILLIIIASIYLITENKKYKIISPKSKNNYQIVSTEFKDKNSISINKTEISTKTTTILLTGDVMLGRSVMGTSLAKNNPNYPFEEVAEVVKSADITFSNLENPITKNCPTSNDGFIFCTDPKMINGLNYAGVDIVNLANNHTKNYGQDGINQTKKYLIDSGIDYVGVENLITKNINGIKFGFLGFDFVSQKPTDFDYTLISDYKKNIDVLIIMVHWGVEYVSIPNSNQKEIAKNLINAGADVIVGGHPHWVQSIEYIGEKPVFYSLGNFIFDQSWSEETKKGLAIKLTYQNNQLLKIDQLPIYMKNFAQPEWVVN